MIATENRLVIAKVWGMGKEIDYKGALGNFLSGRNVYIFIGVIVTWVYTYIKIH